MNNLFDSNCCISLVKRGSLNVCEVGRFETISFYSQTMFQPLGLFQVCTVEIPCHYCGHHKKTEKLKHCM